MTEVLPCTDFGHYLRGFFYKYAGCGDSKEPHEKWTIYVAGMDEVRDGRRILPSFF
jgi:hypothetical protein